MFAKEICPQFVHFVKLLAGRHTKLQASQASKYLLQLAPDSRSERVEVQSRDFFPSFRGKSGQKLSEKCFKVDILPPPHHPQGEDPPL